MSERPAVSNSRTQRLIETYTRVEQELERDKRIAKIKAHAEQLRQKKLANAWQPLFDTWILTKSNPSVPCDMIAIWISEATGLTCQVVDVYRRKRFLTRRR